MKEVDNDMINQLHSSKSSRFNMKEIDNDMHNQLHSSKSIRLSSIIQMFGELLLL